MNYTYNIDGDLSFNTGIVGNTEEKLSLKWMPLHDENEIESSLRPALVKVELAGVGVDQSMCSSILNLPHLLLQEEGKQLSIHSVTAS